MTVYRGWRDEHGTAHVSVNGRGLDYRLDLENHSPTGLEWGYGGSGPAQLALALLADALRKDNPRTADRRAVALHQQFKWAVIAKLDKDKDWMMTDKDVRNALKSTLRSATVG